jgi:thioredoxin-like negative regulator of GroEL
MKTNLKKAGIAYDEIDIGKKDGAAIASRLNIRALPTFFLFDEAVPLKSYPGVMPVAQLEKIKHKYL